MRDDQLCLNCEWWDDREHEMGADPRGEMFRCLRWPEGKLKIYGYQRCWQWAKKAVDQEPEEPDTEKVLSAEERLRVMRQLRTPPVASSTSEAGLPSNDGKGDTEEAIVRRLRESCPEDPERKWSLDLEKAVGLVREAGLSTGHAENCTDLVRELLGEITEQRRVAGKATGDWAQRATDLKARWDQARRLLYQACLSGLNDPPEGWDEEARQLLREGLLRAGRDG